MVLVVLIGCRIVLHVEALALSQDLLVNVFGEDINVLDLIEDRRMELITT